MLFNERQGVVLDDIARFWRDDKVSASRSIPCIFFVDIRGSSFHVTFEENDRGKALRDKEFFELVKRM
jgi:class 3 adenylate cyclase